MDRSRLILQAFFEFFYSLSSWTYSWTAVHLNKVNELFSVTYRHRKTKWKCLKYFGITASQQAYNCKRKRERCRSTVPWIDRFWLLLSTMVGRMCSNTPGSSQIRDKAWASSQMSLLLKAVGKNTQKNPLCGAVCAVGCLSNAVAWAALVIRKKHQISNASKRTPDSSRATPPTLNFCIYRNSTLRPTTQLTSARDKSWSGLHPKEQQANSLTHFYSITERDLHKVSSKWKQVLTFESSVLPHKWILVRPFGGPASSGAR